MNGEAESSLFIVPKEPVDGYTILYWHASISDIWVYINEMKVTYYVNTPYEEYAPGEKRGVPLVDDWMISKKSERGNWSGEGRICGWGNIFNWGESGVGSMFRNKEDAYQEAIRKYDDYIARAERRIADMGLIRDGLRNGKDSHR